MQSKRAELCFSLVVLLGLVYRVIWPGDMVWLQDERWLFDLSQRIYGGEPWPSVGMTSSQGIANPGLSAWLFIGIGQIVHDPVSMVKVVQWTNVAAVCFFWVLIRRVEEPSRRGILLFSLALFSVSLLPVHFSRKIWQQCLLPLFTFPLYAAYGRREGFGFALLIGVLAALASQVHMSGFIFFPILFLVTIVLDRKNGTLVARFAGGVTLGAVVGSVPMIPWLTLLRQSAVVDPHPRFFRGLIRLGPLRWWLQDAWSLGPSYLLGTHHLSELSIVGLLTEGLLLVLGVSALFGGKRSEAGVDTARIVYLSCCLYAIVYLVMGLRFYAHYWIIAYPFVHLWMGERLAAKPRVGWAFLVSSALVTGLFLFTIHRTGGFADSEYGRSFAAQNPPK